jgi:hypothetical protein
MTLIVVITLIIIFIWWYCSLPSASSPFVWKLSIAPNNSKLDPVMDSRLNFYDICMECCLLQQHLINPRRRCRDCIRKHFLTITGLLNEARCLKNSDMISKKLDTDICSLVKQIQQWHKEFEMGHNPTKLSQNIRQFRKKLVNAGLGVPPPYN